MGSVIEIPRIIRQKKKTITVFDNADRDLRELIDEYLGSDAANLFDQVLEQERQSIMEEYGIDEIPGDDYEAISDGYRNMLVDTMNKLQEIVYANRLDRKKLEAVWKNLHDNL